MIVSGGENVYPAEVESVLTGHSDIAEVAVVVCRCRAGASPRSRWWYPGPARRRKPAEVIAWCRERLAHFKCPVAVELVHALPRNASDKLLKNRPREQYGAGVPAGNVERYRAS